MHRPQRLCRAFLRAAVPAIVAVMVVAGVLVIAAPPAHAAVQTATDNARAPWSMPVPGPVVEAFRAPSSPYGPGHRGVDLAVADGTPVVAAGDGTVAYAGAVAGTLHVVVAHEGGLRTTYSFLTALIVHAGDTVHRGDVLGRATAAGGPDHPPGVLHFGLRVGDTYVDPMLLFEDADVAAFVHLVPVGGHANRGDAAHERGLLVRLFGAGRGVARALTASGDALTGAGAEVAARAVSVVETSAGAIDVVARTFAGAVVGAGSVMSAAWAQIWDVAAPTVHLAMAFGAGRVGTVVTGVQIAMAGLRGIGDFAAAMGHCTDTAPPLGAPGDGHLVMTVAGLGSRSGDAAVDALPLAQLGYTASEVLRFSYRDDAVAYGPSDTFGPVIEDARRLGAQLKAAARDHPGAEVDLIGHSLGGLVVRAFLELVYDPTDPGYPPLGPAIALAAPMTGAPLASIGHSLLRSVSLHAASEVAHRAVRDLPPASAAVVSDLAEGSELLRRVDEAPLPDGQELVSIGAVDDVIVPVDDTRAHGLRTVVVNPPGIGNDHAEIVRAPETLGAIRLALDGRDPPCQSLFEHVRARVEPYVIEMAEHLQGDAVRVAGQVLDQDLHIPPRWP